MLDTRKVNNNMEHLELLAEDILIYELDERLEFGVVAMDIPPINGSNCSQNLYKC